MTPKLNTERIIYTLVILLSVIALVLVALSPATFLQNKVVYQGF
jgi:hypothetical protein